MGKVGCIQILIVMYERLEAMAYCSRVSLFSPTKLKGKESKDLLRWRVFNIWFVLTLTPFKLSLVFNSYAQFFEYEVCFINKTL
jgi:hypothetical protein